MEFGALMFCTDYAMRATEFRPDARSAGGSRSVWTPGWPATATPGPRRVLVMLPSAKSDTILPTLDRRAELIRRVG